MPRVRCAAFTLLEVLLVITLLGVVAAISWPDYGQARRSEELDESARRLKSLIQMCRARSMNEGRRYCLTFRMDGTLLVTRQRDPILAPHQYFQFRANWADLPYLLEHVWVESILPLPEGPPPMELQDELIEFEQFDDEPIPIADLDHNYELRFEPDGISNSLRWILRDADGRGLQMTLDGRLGRVEMVISERTLDEPERPESIDSGEEIEYEEDQPELNEEDFS